MASLARYFLKRGVDLGVGLSIMKLGVYVGVGSGRMLSYITSGDRSASEDVAGRASGIFRSSPFACSCSFVESEPFPSCSLFEMSKCE